MMMTKMKATMTGTSQSLYVVIGGRLTDPQSTAFRDPSQIEVVGVYGCETSAKVAWRGRAQATVDDALMRFFILPVHELIRS